MPYGESSGEDTKLSADLQTLRDARDRLFADMPLDLLAEVNRLIAEAEAASKAPVGLGLENKDDFGTFESRFRSVIERLEKLKASQSGNGPQGAVPLSLGAALAASPDAAEQARWRVRFWLKWLGPLLLATSVLAVWLIAGKGDSRIPTGVALWSMATGGLGAICNAFLRLMNVVDDDRRTEDLVFYFWGRVFLGVLFGLVLGVALALNQKFPTPDSPGDWQKNLLWLTPFLAGNSLSLVLGIIDKVTQAVEMAFALNTGRQVPVLPAIPASKEGGPLPGKTPRARQGKAAPRDD